MNNLLICMYHYTRDLINSEYPCIKGLDKDLFIKQIDFFKDNFNVITMQDFLDVIDNKKELPEKALLLTFDDGYIDNYEVAYPILKEKGLQGSFFIPARPLIEKKVLNVNKIHFVLAKCEYNNNIESLLKDVFDELNKYRNVYHYPENDRLFEEYAVANRFDPKEIMFIKRILQNAIDEEARDLITNNLFNKYIGESEKEFAGKLYLNIEQIKEMKDNGMFIGIHGYNHNWLGELNKNEMMNDIDKALDVLSDFIDKDNWVMNYPYGSYNQETIDYISSKGCKLGLTTDVRIVDINKDNRYLIPRLDCNDFPPKSNNYIKIIGDD